jgi:hypothetical protein
VGEKIASGNTSNADQSIRAAGGPAIKLARDTVALAELDQRPLQRLLQPGFHSYPLNIVLISFTQLLNSLRKNSRYRSIDPIDPLTSDRGF